ncbi:MAG: hypothetical protein CSA53_02855 [Gammaproteobacteria bacterium]|nr:MAG: hypothetical protein CSA53_02855 [Gammaproteobacteria bacterium]
MKFLEKILVACVLIGAAGFGTSQAVASDAKQLKLLETAEAIEFVSQSIPKAYFYRGKGIRAAVAKKEIDQDMSVLRKSIKSLGGMNLSSEERNILSFFKFTLSDLESVITEPFSLENGALIIDLGESLLEGAELIVSKHRDAANDAENMLLLIERMELLLERVNKYYISHYSGLRDEVNVTQVRAAVVEFETGLAELSKNKGYHATQASSVRKINEFWPIAEQFYVGIEQGTLPVIVLASTSSLEKELDNLKEFYFKKALRK